MLFFLDILPVRPRVLIRKLRKLWRPTQRSHATPTSMRPGSWHTAAPPHQAFTSDPAGVVSDAVRFCPFATGNDILYAKACTSRHASRRTTRPRWCGVPTAAQ